MSKIHYVNVLEGKKTYSIEDVKSLDQETFKSVLGSPKLQNKLSVVQISQQQRDAMKKGESVTAADLGAISTNEVKEIALQKNLLQAKVDEQGNEIANLQRLLAESNKQNTPVQTEETEETEAKKSKKK